MGYYCYDCEEDISEKEAKYSKQNFGKYLCRDCQEDYDKIKSSPRKSETIKPKSTPEAERLYVALKKKGIPVTLEKWDGYKHIDLAISKAKLNIEVDGAHHNFKSEQALSDLKRTAHSLNKGYETIRIPNSLIKDDIRFKETVEYIIRIYKSKLNKLEEDNDDLF